jgi:hypothetical protein
MALCACHARVGHFAQVFYQALAWSLLMQGDCGLFRYCVVCPLTAYIPSADSLLGATNLDAIALR